MGIGKRGCVRSGTICVMLDTGADSKRGPNAGSCSSSEELRGGVLGVRWPRESVPDGRASRDFHTIAPSALRLVQSDIGLAD
jgi:hypothetical protein